MNYAKHQKKEGVILPSWIDKAVVRGGKDRNGESARRASEVLDCKT